MESAAPADKSPYIKMYADDGLGVSFEHWEDSRSVEMHQHEFYELFFIAKGSCTHTYKEQAALLIPGDVMLVTPHSAHGFSFGGTSSIFNCQFLPGELDSGVIALLSVGERRDFGTDLYDPSGDNDSGNGSLPGVIHLNPREQTFIMSLFDRVFENDFREETFSALKKRKFAELIILEVYQAFRRQNRIFRVPEGKKQRAVAEVLAYMEEHLNEPLNLDLLASEHGFSTNYFRKLLRESTGLSPVKYMNRLRISRVCEYMKLEDMPAAEAAERVGFVDMNYFSRTFKQVMGCSPSKL